MDNVEGDPVEVLGGVQVGNVHDKVLHDIVRLEQETADGKASNLNGTVIPAFLATVNHNLGFVYELQFRVMQENLGVMEKNYELSKDEKMRARDEIEQSIVLKNYGAIEAMPLACASGTRPPMQIQFNVPLKSPNKYFIISLHTM